MASLATLRTNAYTTMYNHIQTGTYTLSTNNIHPNYTDKQMMKEGYPQIIIWEPIINKVILTKGLITNAIKQAFITYHVQIWHNNAVDIKTQVDEVDNKISTGLSVFRTAGLRPVRDGFITESYGHTYRKPNETLYFCDMSIQFKYVGST